MMAAVLQLSLVRTVLFFVLLVLWTDEKYDYGDVSGRGRPRAWVLRGSGASSHRGFLLQVDSVKPNVYVNAVVGASTAVSFYGYLLFYKATSRSLPGYGLRAKFICIIVVLVLCGLQSGILETMGALGVIPCIPPLSVVTRSQCRSCDGPSSSSRFWLAVFWLTSLCLRPPTVIYHYCVIVEMFCIGLYARHTFRKVEPRLEAEEGPLRLCQAHQAVQTDGHVGPSSEEARAGGHRSGAANPTFTSAEDTLCRIEHAPLDGFHFPPSPPREPASPEDPGRGPTRFTIRAETNQHSCSDITVV